jgi:hypothetical protein
MKNRALVAALSAIISSLCCNPPKESDSLQVYLSNKTAIELVKINSFPKDDDYQKPGFLVSPRKLGQDRDGNIYVADVGANHLQKFTIDGQLIKTIGNSGQAPGDFSAPRIVDIAENFIMAYDMNNRRVQFLSLDGEYSYSFNVFKGFQALAIDSNGIIYGVPVISPFEKNIKLIDAMSQEGIRNGSFGLPLRLDGDPTIVNMGRIDIGVNGDIYFAFQHYPEVSIYSSKGELRGRCYLKNSEFERRKKINVTNMKKSLQNRHKRLPLFTLIDEIRATEGGFMILKNAPPCLEIMEYDTRGTLLRTYYWVVPSDEQILATDFSYWKDREKQVFSILNVYPEPRIDVLSPILAKEEE